LKNFIFTALFCATISGFFAGCALLEGPKNIEELSGDEKINECIKLHARVKSLESHLLDIDNCYANPSTANDCVETYDELERTVAYFNKVCAGENANTVKPKLPRSKF
jgi:putative lipoprotein